MVVIYHTFRPLAFTIHELGIESGVPYFIASGNRAAYPTGARRRKVPRAEILAPAATPATILAATAGAAERCDVWEGVMALPPPL